MFLSEGICRFGHVIPNGSFPNMQIRKRKTENKEILECHEKVKSIRKAKPQAVQTSQTYHGKSFSPESGIAFQWKQ